VPLRVEDLAKLPGAGAALPGSVSVERAGAHGLIHTDGCQIRCLANPLAAYPPWYCCMGLWDTPRLFNRLRDAPGRLAADPLTDSLFCTTDSEATRWAPG